MPKDDATLLRFVYVVFAGLVAFIAYQAIHTTGAQTGWDEKYDQWFPIASQVIAVVIGVVGAYLLSANPERHEYFLSVMTELRKVTWPSFDDTRKMTVVVVTVVGIFGVILAFFDWIWSEALKLMLT